MAEKYKRRFGDLKYARRIRKINGMEQLNIDVKPNRSVSDVYINQKMDVTILADYLAKKKEEGTHITFFHAFLAAIGKTYYSRPQLNRFVKNRHLYEHNTVSIGFVAKVSFEDRAEEMMTIVPIEENDNIFTISEKVTKMVSSFRDKKATKEGANNAMDVLGKLPNIVRVPVVGFFKFLDKKGRLPGFLRKDNLYFSSIIVSNLGSIKCGAICHNINDFGCCSDLATMGEIKNEEIIDEKGEKHIRKICEFGINLDERVGDGYYFAKAVHILQYLFDNPELLEEDANAKVEIAEIR